MYTMSFRTDNYDHPDIYFYPDFASLKSDFEFMLRKAKAEDVKELKKSDLADLKKAQKNFAYEVSQNGHFSAVYVSIHKTHCVCEQRTF